MVDETAKHLPQRWAELDKRTIEWIARLNEDERRRLIEVGNLSARQLKRLVELLSLPDDKWEAGFKIVTRSVVLSRAMRSFPKFVLGLAALLVAINQIWGYASPYVLRMFK